MLEEIHTTISPKGGEKITEEHLIALQKLCPKAEWTFTGTDIVWHGTRESVPTIADIEAALPVAVKEYQDKLILMDLIQMKLHELAITALKADGLLDDKGTPVEKPLKG